MSDWTLTRSEQEAVVVRSSAELETLLDEVATRARQEERPALVALTSPSGDVMTIGLGREYSTLSFTRGDRKPPYLSSHNPVSASSEEVVPFSYFGHWTEFRRSAVISVQDARAAVREFFETGMVPTSIAWTEV